MRLIHSTARFNVWRSQTQGGVSNAVIIERREGGRVTAVRALDGPDATILLRDLAVPARLYAEGKAEPFTADSVLEGLL